MRIEDELQEAAEEDSLVVGTEETVKGMDSLDRVVLASNTPPRIADTVVSAADKAGVEVSRSEVDSDQLGSLCGKPFAASVVGIR